MHKVSGLCPQAVTVVALSLFPACCGQSALTLPGVYIEYMCVCEQRDRREEVLSVATRMCSHHRRSSCCSEKITLLVQPQFLKVEITL